MKAVDQVIKDMQERPRDFFCCGFYLTDKKTNLVYWIANGIGFYRIHAPYTLNFGFIDECRFHLALNRWKNTYAVQLAQEARHSGAIDE